MKISLRLAVAGVIMLALCGLLYWSNRHPPTLSADKSSATAAAVILNLDPDSVTSLSTQLKDSPQIVLNKTASGLWQITAPEQARADQDYVKHLVTNVSALHAVRVVESNAPDLKTFGLDPPVLEVKISGKNLAEKKLLIGDYSPVSESAYAMVVGDPRVFSIASFVASNLSQGMDSMRDRRLLTADVSKMNSMELVHGGQTIEFTRNADGWQIVKPESCRTDQIAADTLADALSGAKMNLTDPGSQGAEAAFEHGTPAAKASLPDGANTQSIEIRRAGNKYYAKSSLGDKAYLVDSSLADGLNKSLDDFRKKNLFDFGYNDLSGMNVEIPGVRTSSGMHALSIVRNPQGWWWNGKKVNPDSMESLIAGLRELTAASFSAAALSTPVITATATSSNGKHVEKVVIAKSGHGYLAMRDNEPLHYVLAAGAIDGIEKAVAGAKTQ